MNAYLREISESDFTAKEFRTWAGTTIAASVLRHFPAPESEAGGQRDMLAAIDTVADELGNTRAVARSSYIHPRIFEAYLDGSLQKIDPDDVPDPQPGGLDDDERVVLSILSASR